MAAPRMAGRTGGARFGRRGARRVLSSAARRSAAAIAIVVSVLAAVVLAKPHGDDVHRADADCRVCHTADAPALKQDPAAAKAALVADLEHRCAGCHDEGPSHRTGIRPARAVPPALPLAADGTIGCATCHFIHGENDAFGDFLRLDNRQGALCLSCHQLSELQ